MADRREIGTTFINLGFSVCKVCKFAGISRSSFYFAAKSENDDGRKKNSGRKIPGYTINPNGILILDATITLLLKRYRTRLEYANGGGYRKLSKLLNREYGLYVNQKKVYRICRENGLLLEKRSKHSRPIRRIARNHIVTQINKLWQCDLKYGFIDGLGKFFFVLAFIDVFSRKVVGAYVGLRCQAGDLRRTLAMALISEGITALHELVIRTDNGSQMTSKEVSNWLSKLEEKLMHEFIPVRTPNKNAYIESFFSILELEFLRMNYFSTFKEAYEKTHNFIRFYNEERIHGSIGYLTPTEVHESYNRGETLKIDAISL